MCQASSGTAHQAARLPGCQVLCENFLYRFKAAPRGRSRRRLGAQAGTLLTRRAGRANAGRLARKADFGGR
jgi:hypothetical protein